jgi:predicted ABC-type transport system involved in lysophospholipase L1 biosynthesis ATPase subunit
MRGLWARERRKKGWVLEVGLAGKRAAPASLRAANVSSGHRPRAVQRRAHPPGRRATGNLDRGGRMVIEAPGIHHQRGLTVVMVTHDPSIAAIADRILTMLDGRIEGATEARSPEVEQSPA